MFKQQENLIKYKTKENVFYKQKKGSNMSGNEVIICFASSCNSLFVSSSLGQNVISGLPS